MTLYMFFSCGQTLLKIQSKEREVLGGGEGGFFTKKRLICENSNIELSLDKINVKE